MDKSEEPLMMEERYLTRNEAITFLKITESKFSRLVAAQEIRPCFFHEGMLQEVLFSKSKEAELDLKGEPYDPDDLYISKRFEFAGFISPCDMNTQIRISKSKENASFKIRDFNIVELNQFEQIFDHAWQALDPEYQLACHLDDPVRKYQVTGNFDIESLKFESGDCLFSRQSLKASVSKLVVASSTESIQTVDHLQSIDKQIDEGIQRQDAIREVMISIFKTNIKISNSAMWNELVKMANEKAYPFIGVTEKNELIHLTGSQADASSETINRRAIEGRLGRLKKPTC